MASAEWTCATCTLANPPSSAVCTTCFALRPVTPGTVLSALSSPARPGSSPLGRGCDLAAIPHQGEERLPPHSPRPLPSPRLPPRPRDTALPALADALRALSLDAGTSAGSSSSGMHGMAVPMSSPTTTDPPLMVSLSRGGSVDVVDPWACHICTFSGNAQGALACEVCAAPRPARAPHRGAVRDGVWACPACQARNEGAAVFCTVCHFPDNIVVLDNARSPRHQVLAPPPDALEADIMGAYPLPHGAGVIFRVWAPSASRVCVAGVFNNWSPTMHVLEAEADCEHFSGVVPSAAVGDAYKYVVFAHDASGAEVPLWRNDPCGRWLCVLPAAGASESDAPEPGVAPPHVGIRHDLVYDSAAFTWTDSDFVRPPYNELVLYELHIGGFTPHGTWLAAIDRLPYLVSLGINAIQLLPPTQDAHTICWGYDPVSLYSPHDSFGTPDEMKSFVDAAHAHGLAVILDWVPNHLSVRSVVRSFDTADAASAGPYIYAEPELRSTPYGPRPNLASQHVQAWLIRSALMWLDEYHLDGIRVDSTGTLRRSEPALHAGASARGAAADLVEAWEFMQELTSIVRARFPDRLLIAEDLNSEPLLTYGGAGFDTQWDPVFCSMVAHQMTLASDALRSMDAIASAIGRVAGGGAPSSRLIYTESHDTIPADRESRLPHAIQHGGESFFALRRTLLAAVLLLTSPGIPMICAGQEVLENHAPPWPTPLYLDWSRLEAASSDEALARTLCTLHTFQTLISLRRNVHGCTGGLTADSVRVFHTNDAANVVAYHRFHRGGRGDDVVVICNVSNTPYAEYAIGVPRSGVWHVRLRFEDEPDSVSRLVAARGAYDLFPFSLTLSLPPYSALILSQDPL
ncbi:1,4-alpha-glucan branching enzyme [Thecamonas trahens ATCC 50062]|uniref:1,4-alpha-glucan branching enzyme n=1 Tax=Thecamonas trahens ATCC 50062 TaxID=461836 RepID=A0A0L0D8C9_THETB|nr:1,4-alpha-glucan branching enzyme [Thecamonas trahens ATCC 50062]KNC48617.1 1,4-alpha-glucan branching enzyme [Thecamonas trahens ATCC 50062]|eukprot:XP_013762673.1 1,4-alpha-glucan branching enzyme [Thecamonas trahens ATCC 50062]